MLDTVDLDQSILLTDLPKLLETHPHVSTLRRWGRQGVGGVKLATWRIGGRRVTCRRSVEEFLRRLNGDGNPRPDGRRVV